MSEEKESYRQIMKATSLFGGVQVFNIIFAIIRSKAVAVLLGPAGMGFAGLLVSTTGLVGSLTNLGLGASAVKDIAAANGSGDTGRVATVVSVFRRLVWITGLLGALATLLLSPWLSQITFGSREHTLAFVWLSCTLLFGQLASGQMVLLQGMRKLQYLAKANMAGTVIGLLVSLPLYYFYGLQGIVPAIIVSSILSMLMAFYWGSRVKIESLPVNIRTIKHEGAGMVKMGIMLSLSGLITTAAAYLIRIFISNQGGIEQVGLYSAGFAIIETYVGLVFTAMGTDYYPRLSAVNNDNAKLEEAVNQQAKISLLILIPIIVLFTAFSPYIIVVLYSNEFVPIVAMINWAILGMLFRAVSWSMGFVFLAKSDSNLFIKTAFFFSALFLINNIIGYSIAGLTGLGISYLVNYILHFAVLLLISRKRYSIKIRKAVLLTMGFGSAICIMAFASSFIDNRIVKHTLLAILSIVAIIYTIHEFRKFLNFKELIAKFLNKSSK
jgi:O-antigen/teichoic acid export membrane protein